MLIRLNAVANYNFVTSCTGVFLQINNSISISEIVLTHIRDIHTYRPKKNRCYKISHNSLDTVCLTDYVIFLH